jgi:hypothetical protein
MTSHYRHGRKEQANCRNRCRYYSFHGVLSGNSAGCGCQLLHRLSTRMVERNRRWMSAQRFGSHGLGAIIPRLLNEGFRFGIGE